MFRRKRRIEQARKQFTLSSRCPHSPWHDVFWRGRRWCSGRRAKPVEPALVVIARSNLSAASRGQPGQQPDVHAGLQEVDGTIGEQEVTSAWVEAVWLAVVGAVDCTRARDRHPVGARPGDRDHVGVGGPGPAEGEGTGHVAPRPPRLGPAGVLGHQGPGGRRRRDWQTEARMCSIRSSRTPSPWRRRALSGAITSPRCWAWNKSAQGKESPGDPVAASGSPCFGPDGRLVRPPRCLEGRLLPKAGHPGSPGPGGPPPSRWSRTGPPSQIGSLLWLPRDGQRRETCAAAACPGVVNPHGPVCGSDTPGRAPP